MFGFLLDVIPYIPGFDTALEIATLTERKINQRKAREIEDAVRRVLAENEKNRAGLKREE